MGIKNKKVFVGSLIAFAIIGLFNSCQDYKLKQESKVGNIIKMNTEEITFDEIFTPAESDYQIEEQPIVETVKSK